MTLRASVYCRWDGRGATLLACNRCEIFNQLLSNPVRPLYSAVTSVYRVQLTDTHCLTSTANLQSARLEMLPPIFMWLPYLGPWIGQALVRSSVEGYQKKYADASAAATFNKASQAQPVAQLVMHGLVTRGRCRCPAFCKT